MTTNNLPEKVEHITKSIVQSVFGLELAAENYQKLLQDAENIVFTRENINQDYSALKQLRDLRTVLKKSKDAKKRPFIDANSAIEDAYKELDKPIEDVLARKTAEFQKVNEEIKAENLKIQQEQQRKVEIQQSITSFINNTTTSITNAITDSEIVRIQKAIGSEKARVSYYKEYIDVLKESCDNLNSLINSRKSFIRESEEIKKKEAEALKSGDIQTATDLMERKELLQAEMAENTIRIQEKAFEQAVNIEVIVPEPNAEVVAPRRKSWKWRVDDVQLLYKKMPHLVELTPCKEKIDDLLNMKKAEGALKDVEELKIFGLTLYLEKLY
jgi:signal transduction histidine kinase